MRPEPSPQAPSPVDTPSADGRRSRKRQQTAEHLVRVAFELFASHGYDQVTMEQIAATADVAKGTLYNHFPVKEALVKARMHADLARELPTLLAALPADLGARTRLRRFLHLSADYSERGRDYLPHYIHYRLSQPIAEIRPEDRSGMNQIFARFIADGQARGEIRSDVSPEQLGHTLQFMYLCALLRWLQIPGIDLKATLDAMVDLIFDGCAGDVRS